MAVFLYRSQAPKPLAKEVRRNRPFPGRWLPPPTQPSKPTHRGRDHPREEHAAPKPPCGFGCLLGQAAAAWIHTLHLRAVQAAVPDRRQACQAAESKVYSQALRTDAIPRPAGTDRCEVRPPSLYCRTGGWHKVVSIHVH